jgi:hypothetical protein
VLLKQTDVRTGHWTVRPDFSFASAIIGPDEKHVFPAAIVQFSSIELMKVDPEDFPNPEILVDASTLDGGTK